MSLERLLGRAAARPAPFLLAGGDHRMLDRALRRLGEAGLDTGAVVGPVRTASDPRLDAVAGLLRTRKPERVRDGIDALDLATDPVRFATGLAALGAVGAVITGPEVPVGSLADAALWALGEPPDGGPVHAASWLLHRDGTLVACADCGLAGELAAAALARLAWMVAQAHQRITSEAPRVAFLGGPPGAAATAVAEAAAAALERLDPGIEAVVDRSVRFRDRTNVLIFPSGTAGHLAVRLGRSLGDTLVLGPLVLGPPGALASVGPDATEDELVGTAALAVLLAGRTNT